MEIAHADFIANRFGCAYAMAEDVHPARAPVVPMASAA